MLREDLLKHGREIRRYLANKQYEQTADGLLLTRAKLAFRGVFTLTQRRHPIMERAFASGDPGRVAWADRVLKALGGPDLCHLGGEYQDYAVSSGPNRVVDQGIVQVLDSALSGGSVITNWYLSLFTTDTTPAADWTAANYRSGGSPKVTEYTDYSEAARPQWLEDGVSGLTITNSPGTADGEFTATNASAVNLYGAALISASGKDGAGDATAKLLAAKRFTDAPRQVKLNDKLHLTYSLTGSSA